MILYYIKYKEHKVECVFIGTTLNLHTKRNLRKLEILDLSIISTKETSDCLKHNDYDIFDYVDFQGFLNGKYSNKN